MKKKRLTKILVEGRPEFLQKLANQIEDKHSPKIEREPETGLVMVKARDSVSMQPFYMGELLVTECTVSISGVLGFGMIKGEELERAYQLAVVDAGFNANIPEVAYWLDELELEEGLIVQRHKKEEAMVAQSRVHFDTMEDYYDKS
ncbi:phosphonate C-P lyase system protein PhnG [Bacillus suaedae]|uniref:Phosphonate C-P lyase system protein PhnG n=1 Tax=Halalkalibacter suaedae TaxID=2822140 RepID=A0A941ATT8_9BACI|nr:phosphonate C-P lyase system protein PhnG [Bacillus suaedae]MBP3952694.1 phosphonate C-P lyase system protein PhnG [Bacillus suaedae]